MKGFRLAVFAALATATTSAAPHVGLVATLEPAPVPGPTTVKAIMQPATPDVRATIAAFVPPEATVFHSVVVSFGAYRPPFFLAEFADGRYALFADFNADGAIHADEQLRFAPADRAAQTAQFVVPGWRHASYPVTFAEPQPLVSRAPSSRTFTARTVTVSNTVAARGRLTVAGRTVGFYLGVDLTTGLPSGTSGQQFVDADANGEFDLDDRSPENARARGVAPIFRVGDAYVSVQSIDAASGRVVFASHEAREYLRFELHAGATLPDFEFVDFSGQSRRLSDYRGQFVLLDFWGTWCGPCIAEMPYLKRAYDTFHRRGFEIIGMNSEHATSPAELAAGLAKARAFGAEHGLTWPEAREESIKSLIDRRFMIETWPTLILLDGDRRIISVDRTDIGQPGLRGDALAATLAALIR